MTSLDPSQAETLTLTGEKVPLPVFQTYYHGKLTVEPEQMEAAHDEVTVEFWAKDSGLTGTQAHLMDWTNIHGRVELRIGLPTPNQYGKTLLWLAGADNTAQFDKIEKKLSDTDMGQITGKWVHWAFTKSAANEMAIYRNGQVMHQGSGKTKKIFIVGEALNKVESRAFKGELVEMRVWKAARTAEEIAANMRTHLSEPHEDLIYRSPE